jgi:hypothetical protein
MQLTKFGQYNSGKNETIYLKNYRGYQNRFRYGRSVIDNIFMLKIINENIWEYNQCTIFIDFQKVYDSIHRDTLWKCMEEFKIPKY